MSETGSRYLSWEALFGTMKRVAFAAFASHSTIIS